MIPQNIKSRANSFRENGSAYIHTEMNKGRDGELLLAGDMQAVLWQANRILNRWAEITGAGFKDTIGMVIALQEFGYHTIYNQNADVKPIDMQGKSMHQYVSDVKEKEHKLNAQIDNIKIVMEELRQQKNRNKELVKSSETYKKRCAELERKMAQQRNKHDKEILKLNHEIDRLIELNGKKENQ